ncbi:D-alanyl-D-alanine carboxypeptidase family protein [Arthrobacter citreus]|uniref:D-alanyl-D-alanine carboxypeptidase family protein n=1 Tax=Arthrobacter TaxID=1663 RepID=UPI001FE93EB6|nr:D-alanyl-D-alanine carboxypeptidase family protein [Arthrobacter gandavensis]
MHIRKSAVLPSLLMALVLMAGSASFPAAGHASDDAAGGSAFSEAAVTLGAPTGPRTCGLRDGGCSRDYQYGSVLWSPAVGAAAIPVRGAVRTAWRAEGAESGSLGYPVQAQVCQEGNCTQRFERGTIIRAKTGGASVQRSIDDSADTVVVVNKQRPLSPVSYAPDDLVNVDGQQLRETAASAFLQLRDAAASDAVGLTALSGYRSYESQARLYDGYTTQYGQAVADTVSARPGHSEHQTGLAVDIAAPDGACSLQACFGDTAAGDWAAENAHRFGFIIRYPDGASASTGYAFEPWHLRYVGPDVAQSMHDHSSATLEDYLGLPPAADY